MDLWRGVACLAVVVYHSTAFAEAPEILDGPNGFAANVLDVIHHFWLGVPIFFAISGYCISATVDSTRQCRGGWRSYFYRRFRRIYPPYWALLALTVSMVVVVESAIPGLFTVGPANFPQAESLTGWQWLGGITLTETWRPLVIGTPSSALFLGPAWTLCYEEQFYLVAGLLLIAAPRWFFAAVAVVSALVFLLTENLNFRVLREAGVDVSRFQIQLPGTFLDGHWLAFAVGVGIYYRLNHATKRGAVLVDGLFLAGIAWCLRSWNHLATSGITRCHLSALVLGVLLVQLKPLDTRIANSTISRPLMFCGRMCYSLYLVHFPVVRAVSGAFFRAGLSSPLETLLVTVPFALIVAIPVGWVFFVCVERHFVNTRTVR